MKDNRHFATRDLVSFSVSLLEALGLPTSDANTVGNSLVAADMRGVNSHGISLLIAYTEQLRHGGINPRPTVRLVRDHAATALLDGDAGMGQVVATRAMALAIDKAAEFGIGAVSVRNSQHFGAAGHYAQMALERGMLGLASSTAGVTMTIPGATGRVIGNNPLAIASPAGLELPILFDTAMSVVSGSKVARLSEAHEPIPEGWVVDVYGQNTTNPSDFFDGGSLLPFGGHKGFGLALMVEVLSGVLAGAALTTDIKLWRNDPDQPSDVGHLLVAISIEAFRSTREFQNDVDMLVQRLGGEGVDRLGEAIRIPGASSHRHAQAASTNGVAVAVDVLESLHRLARELGIAMPAPLSE
ncbi:MAG: Ldh family oxidoreductase [Truepera sp.]|nr:Ldh family oxidoreductase [Truepera sp.]